MSKLIIEGGNKLKGSINISGNKNAILPCMAATLLTSDQVTLTNVPDISDVEVFLQIIKSLGVKVDRDDQSLKIWAEKISTSDLPEDLTNKLRGSVLLAGSLLGRTRKVTFHHPGGDIIGKRSIEPHFEGFEQLGYETVVTDGFYKINEKKVNTDCHIFLEMPFVTGTENLLLAAVLKPGSTVIRNAASEPHVVDLCMLLNKMGAQISGIGTRTLAVQGVEKLSGTEFEIGSDTIELGTYAIAAAITKGDITLSNCKNIDLEPISWPLQKMGIRFDNTGDSIRIFSQKLTAIPELKTNVWPGFPTDLMSAAVVLATQAEGISLLHDWMYESRMFFVDKLINMGANITIADPHRVLVYGPTPLVGKELETPDIRAGMALVLAALVAKGTSLINRAELIDRGYEDVTGNLSKIGANIKKVD